eukprot:gene33888-43779_t
MAPASVTRTVPGSLVLSGHWTASGVGDIERQIAGLAGEPSTAVDGSGIEALDTAGAWMLQRMLTRLRGEGGGPAALAVHGLAPPF